MIRKIWIINLTLAIAALLMFSAAIRAWNRSGSTVTGIPAETSGDPASAVRIEKRSISIGSYDAIEKNNLFSPERAASARKVDLEAGKEGAVAEDITPADIQQKYTLFGIILKGSEARALIQAPVQDDKAKPTRWVSVNDKLDEFTVSEILRDKIYIKNSANRYAIPLNKVKEAGAPSVPTAKQTVDQEAPKVISTQSTEVKKNTTEVETEGDVVIDGDYKIVETPFGKSRIRIK
jgi:hypothetical protein